MCLRCAVLIGSKLTDITVFWILYFVPEKIHFTSHLIVIWVMADLSSVIDCCNKHCLSRTPKDKNLMGSDLEGAVIIQVNSLSPGGLLFMEALLHVRLNF